MNQLQIAAPGRIETVATRKALKMGTALPVQYSLVCPEMVEAVCRIISENGRDDTNNESSCVCEILERQSA